MRLRKQRGATWASEIKVAQCSLRKHMRVGRRTIARSHEMKEQVEEITRWRGQAVFVLRRRVLRTCLMILRCFYNSIIGGRLSVDGDFHLADDDV